MTSVGSQSPAITLPLAVNVSQNVYSLLDASRSSYIHILLQPPRTTTQNQTQCLTLSSLPAMPSRRVHSLLSQVGIH